QECVVCHQSGASITCLEEGCDRSFHLPCAMAGGCITRYIGLYRSYCSDHRPEQEVEVAPQTGTECLMCMEPVDKQVSYRTMVCPACKTAWFHRHCILALHAGITSFQCLPCRDGEAFLAEMFTMGIQIPFR
ncbi:G2E3 ligase, partial [Bucco capensis]|nr:G2E3 ligase [Bucco capensis]